MGKGGKAEVSQRPKSDTGFTWEEIKKHSSKEDRWLVIENEVYDITEWSKKHPGGPRVIGHYAGQDATKLKMMVNTVRQRGRGRIHTWSFCPQRQFRDNPLWCLFAFKSFHNDLSQVKKFLKPIHLGYILEKERKIIEVDQDFKELRETAEKMGLFKPSHTFFALQLAHILLLELLIVPFLLYFGNGWIPFLVALAMATTVQAQAGWLQHDYGHLSVFKSSRWNRIIHLFFDGVLKGVPKDWWNHMHFQHHAKPNVLAKDPDVRLDALFVLGDVMPVEIAKKKKSSMPYNYQHRYFHIFTPLLFPIYFQGIIFYHMYTRKQWFQLFLVFTYFARFFLMYVPIFGLGWSLVFYFLHRCLESQWFTWVSQSNHIPMRIKYDESLPWVPLQLNATCNLEKSFFNDWFTGHLNFQIEHHLFPTMPRHNYYKIAPLVKSLCEKHGIKYQLKSMSQAFGDIIRMLKVSGELWEVTYKAYHLS